MMKDQLELDQFDNDQPETIRLKHLVQVNPPKSEAGDLPTDTEVSFVPLEGFGTSGTIDSAEIKYVEEVYDGYTYFREGDIAIAKITPSFQNGKGAICEGLENGIGFGTTELHILRPQQETDTRFLWYVLRAKPFMDGGEASMRGVAGQQRVPSEFVENYEIPLLPLDKQQSVVDFIDYHTSHIDKLIEKKKLLLDLLDERQESLITLATTEGLENRTRFKESEIPTIGKIPDHWKVVPNRAVFREVDDRSEDGSEELLSVSHKTGVTLRSEKEVNMFEAESLEGYKLVKPGDLVINTMWAWMGAVGTSQEHGLVSPSYHVYQPTGQMTPEFADLFYRIPPYVAEMGRYSKGVWKSRSRLYPDVFLRMDTILPPKAEQETIVKRIQEESNDTNELSNQLIQSIELLEEKRQALITAAVTDQIDVTDWEPPEQEAPA